MDFLKQVNKLPQKDQMGTLVDLFGLEYADDVAVLTGSLETYQKSIDALKASGKDGKPAFLGSMDKEFAARSATTANNLQLFKSQLSHLAVSIGSVMLPAVNDLLNSLKPMVDSFIRFSQANPELIKNIYLAITAFVGFKAGSLVVRYALSLLSSAVFGMVGKFLSLSATLLRLRGAMQLLSLGRGVAALRLLGLSARQARAALSLFSSVGSLLSGSLRLLASGFNWVLHGLMSLAAYVPILIQGFMRLGAFLLTNPIGIALALLATAAYLLYTRWDAVVGGAKLLWQDLSRVVSLVATSITTFFSTAWATITAVFNTAMNAILTRIQTFSPVTAFQAAFAAVSGFFSGLVSTFMSYGGMLIDGLANGIRAKIGNVLASVRSMAASVKSAFTGAMQIHSPSRVFRSYGGFITEGLAIGVNKGASKPVSRISQLAGSLKTSFEASFSGAKNRFTERMSGFCGDLSARLSANADALSQARTEAKANQINNGGAITIHFNPTINAADSNPQQIETALQMGLREFEDLFKRMMADQQRRAY